MSWSTGKLPSAWKTATVIPILKKDKPQWDPRSYRPISLTSTLCKLLERILKARLEWYLERNNLLNKNQAGFRKHRGCSDQTTRLTKDIALQIRKKHTTIGVFLDLEKAFDLAWTDGILLQLSEMGLPTKMLDWIKDFLKDRYIQVRVGNSLSDPIKLQNGTPQGSVLSPLLFIVLLNSFPQPPDNIKVSMYADDIAIWTSGRTVKRISKKMQDYLNKAASFLTENGFKLSADKSKFVTFSRNTRIGETEINLQIHNKPIQRSESVHFLGLELDRALSFTKHAKQVENKCQKRLNAMRAISGLRSGASKSVLLMVYRSYIRSVLDYGSEAFDVACPTAKKIYERIQSKALAIACGSCKGTSAASLQVECGEPPLDLRRRRFLGNLAAKSYMLPNHPTNDTFFPEMVRRGERFEPEHAHSNNIKIEEKLIPGIFHMKEEDRRLMERGAMKLVPLSEPPWTLIIPKIDTKLSQIDGIKEPAGLPLALERISLYADHLQCYTDASKEQSGTGIGIYIPRYNTQISLKTPKEISIFSAELAAIEKCLDVLSKESEAPSNIAIFSDSLSVITALENSGNNDPELDKSLILISNLKEQGKTVTIVWVPSHNGIRGNEKADELAKAAVKKTLVDLELPISLKDMKRLTKDTLLKEWQEKWRSYGGRYKSIEDRVSFESKFQCTPRRKEVLISRLRLGKCLLKGHLFNIGLHESGICDYCPQEVEDVNHLLTRCPGRSDLHHKLRQSLSNDKWDLKTILSSKKCISIIDQWVRESYPGGL